MAHKILLSFLYQEFNRGGKSALQVGGWKVNGMGSYSYRTLIRGGRSYSYHAPSPFLLRGVDKF